MKKNNISTFFRTKSTVKDYYGKIAWHEYWIISWNQSTISFTLLKSSLYWNFARKLNICTVHSVEIAEILYHTFFRWKQWQNSWFDEIFFSEKDFRVFPHRGKVDKNTITNFTERSTFFRQINFFLNLLKSWFHGNLRVVTFYSNFPHWRICRFTKFLKNKRKKMYKSRFILHFHEIFELERNKRFNAIISWKNCSLSS